VHHLIAHPHAVHAVILLHPHVIRLAVRLARAAVTAVLSRWPKISVITPTWHRRELLTGRCIPSVAAQTYPGEIEHVIVCDGPDPSLSGLPGVTFLPEHRPVANRGVLARLHGTRLAAGDLIAYLDDDNAWRPRHLELLAAAVSAQGASFAYSRALCRNEHGRQWVVGCGQPVFGQVDTSLIMHRAGLLATATWQPSGRPADWDLVDRWLAAGATWAHVPVITLDYYAHDPLPAPA
jgi:glycosyltransferase involved in cell wall biosynthesis